MATSPQFMVSSNLEPEDIMASADSLPLPASVVSYFQGAIGVPPGGFPEPLTSKVRKGRSLPDGSAAYDGRPGATMPDYDFAEAKKELVEKYGEFAIDETEVLSHAMYPQVTEFPLPRTTRGAHAATHYTRQPSAPSPSSEPRPPRYSRRRCTPSSRRRRRCSATSASCRPTSTSTR